MKRGLITTTKRGSLSPLKHHCISTQSQSTLTYLFHHDRTSNKNSNTAEITTIPFATLHKQPFPLPHYCVALVFVYITLPIQWIPNTLLHRFHEQTRQSMSIIVQQDATINSFLYFCRLLYMFRVIPLPIIRSTCKNCNYSIWHWSNRICHLLPSWRSQNSEFWLLYKSVSWQIWFDQCQML